MENQIQPQINIEIGEIINRAWELTKKHFPVFLLLLIMAQIVGGLPNQAYYGELINEIIRSNGDIDHQYLNELQMAAYTSGKSIVLYLIALLLGSYIGIVTLRLLNDVVQGVKPDMTVAFKESYRNFLFFIGVYWVYVFIIALGMLMCLIPGIYLAVRYMFVPMIAANRRDVAFSEAFSMSWKMTKSHFWQLFLFGIVSIGINIVGFICCCIGILLTSIITYIMYALLYKELSKELITD